MNKDLRIVFMGTPDFAVASLKSIVEAGFNVVGVITAPDKPAGRGQLLSKSAVKIYAEEQQLTLLQPSNLKDEVFLNDLKSLNANLQVVVAFRMLPEVVWNMPELGTFNLHASLLPQYRGAAPINWAIINGEKETGVSTFFLQHEIDTGEIIFQEKVTIGDDETAGELHDKLMLVGAKLVVKTLNAIAENNVQTTPQENSKELKLAYKIFKPFCKIDWTKSIKDIHNHIRGLSPYPAAFTQFKYQPTGKVVNCKIFKSKALKEDHNHKIGDIFFTKNDLKIAVKDGFIVILELQPEGKKRMKTTAFLNGVDMNDYLLIV
ncbi:MAG: methionyl-tRNA formyltransferase [Flavobacteriales bacterium]|nr:methionyl-tRNA formyltransferase [Flavobacteriales bacterium]MCW8912340.1 methionyl-tRNA formyltransferase [Flavobacteriales bacterium]MCW8938071.1 methionyl-tRNA formyltransferase [Flavobacteriales bacterium]MCW8940249.1 methionyl-tRNA formyltransferase [Flavobacteriales bacterium]MCW8969411.1 methionyl-tRNA formyltransferase [Flavobacteriales bacterium]